MIPVVDLLNYRMQEPSVSPTFLEHSRAGVDTNYAIRLSTIYLLPLLAWLNGESDLGVDPTLNLVKSS